MAEEPPTKKLKSDAVIKSDVVRNLVEKIEALDFTLKSPASILSDPEWSLDLIKPGRGLYQPGNAQRIVRASSESSEPSLRHSNSQVDRRYVQVAENEEEMHVNDYFGNHWVDLIVGHSLQQQIVLQTNR